MRLVIWSVFGLLAVLWTAGAWIAAELAQWVAQFVGTGAASQWGTAAATWPVPGWVALWVDPAWIQGLQSATLWTVEAMRDALPFLGSALGWVTPLVWGVWAVGAVFLVGATIVALWLAGRAGRAARPYLGPGALRV